MTRRAGAEGSSISREAYPLAAWAAQHEAPLVHGRVIPDTVDDALPVLGRVLGGVLGGYGRLQIRHLWGTVAGRPALLGKFTRLARRLRGVNRRLAELAQAVVAALLRS